jgi:plasmid stability protein
MRTIIDLPEALVERVKISAARHKTSIGELVIRGLETILSEEEEASSPESALERLRAGYALGNQPLPREETHAREAISRYQHPALRL